MDRRTDGPTDGRTDGQSLLWRCSNSTRVLPIYPVDGARQEQNFFRIYACDRGYLSRSCDFEHDGHVLCCAVSQFHSHVQSYIFEAAKLYNFIQSCFVLTGFVACGDRGREKRKEANRLEDTVQEGDGGGGLGVGISPLVYAKKRNSSSSSSESAGKHVEVDTINK